MKDWFQQLERREQRTLAIGFVMLILMVTVYVSSELNTANDLLREQLRQEQASLQQMQVTARIVQRLRGNNEGTQTGNSSESLLAIVDRTSKSANLANAVKRVQPDGSSGVRVWLEGGEFNRVVTWLDQLLARHGAQLKSATFERGESTGRVNARISLERSES